MKVQIRFGTFETNSSSTHSLVILNEHEYSDYKKEKIMYDRNGDQIDVDEFNKVYEKNLSRAKKLFEANASEARWYHSAEEMAKEDTEREFDAYCMDIIHEEREINGVKVHALSIYGYED